MRKIIFCTILCFALFACGQSEAKAQEKIQESEQKAVETKTEIAPIEITEETVKAQTISDFLDLEGSAEYGVLGSKPIKFVFTKVKDNKIEGYNVLLNRKGFICEDVFGNDNLFANGNTTQRPFTGTYKAVEKYDNQEGFYYWEIEMSVKEPGTDEWDGEFEFTLIISYLYGKGTGTWKSFNGKLTRELEICGPED